MLALMKPKNAVTVSIIATVLSALVTTERQASPHSQKDFEAAPEIAIQLMIWSNTASGRMAHCRRFVAGAARNQGKRTAVLWWPAEVGRLGCRGESGSFGPLEYVIHGRHDRRGLVAIEFGQPIDQHAQPLRNLGRLLVEKDTKPVTDFIADGAAMSAVYP